MFRLPLPVILVASLLVSAAEGADAPVRRTPGVPDFQAAIDLAPPGALSVAVVPNPKLAADDLAECLARAGGDASAVPLRPLDLARGQFGIGNGLDEAGALVIWSEMRDGAPVMAALVPVTDPKAFIESSLQKVEGEDDAYTHPRFGKVFVRDLGRRVIASPSRELVQGYAPTVGLARTLQARLGERGWSVMLSGDIAAWAGPDALRAMRTRAQAESGSIERARPAPKPADAAPDAPAAPRPAAGTAPSPEVLRRADMDGNGEIDNGDQSLLLMEMGTRGPNPADLNGDGVVDDADLELMKASIGQPLPGRAASRPAQQEATTDAPKPAAETSGAEDPVTDGVLSVDLDPLGISLRSYAVLNAQGALGRAARGGPRGNAARLDHLPRGPFVLAASADMRGLGGGDAFLDLLASVPGAPELPTWVRENRDLVTGGQIAIYPSKLGIAGGGLLNEAIVFMQTADAPMVRQLLRDWMQGLAGIEGATERKVSWEPGKTLKDGQTADAYAVTEGAAPADAKPADGPKPRARRGADPMQRLARALVFGPRGPNGFVKDVPGGVLLTFSQRPDVLQRGTQAAEGKQSLQGDEVIESLRGWLTPDPDVVGYVGVGSLLSVVRQAAASFPGAALQLPDAPPNLEPVAFSLEVQDGRVETATMMPAGVIAVIKEAYDAARNPQSEEGDDEAPEPAERPAPRRPARAPAQAP